MPKVTFKPSRGFTKFRKQISNLASQQVETGYFEESTYPDGTSVAARAAVHEYGNVEENIPPRPTLVPGIEEARTEIRDVAFASAQKIGSGAGTGEDLLNIVGVVSEGAVKAAIAALISPPLAPITIELKGHDKPLIETGLMIASVQNKIKDKSYGWGLKADEHAW